MRARERARALRGPVAATSFLTRVPLGGLGHRVTEEDLRAGVAWFPAIGAVVGSIGAAVGWLVSFRAPAALAGIVVVVTETILTGALHLDGLADTADGIGAASTGRDGREAMRDPRVGVFGVTAIVLDLALRMAATGALLAGPSFPWGIVAAAAAARFAPLALARSLPYVAGDGGVGVWVGDAVGTSAMLFGLATALGVCTIAGATGGGAVVAATIVVTVGIGLVSRRRFGGVTGDVFGASIELAQTIALAAVVVAAGR
jgi:adenosylcobinamide-GDP ribazoletransferase